jgi:hypothetical protein
MAVALSHQLPTNTLSKLIIVDIAPSRGDISSEFLGYIEGMKKIRDANVSSRKEAQAILTHYEKVFFIILSFNLCPNVSDGNFHRLGSRCSRVSVNKLCSS